MAPSNKWSELKMSEGEMCLENSVLMDAFADETTCHVVLLRVKKAEEEEEEEVANKEGAVKDNVAKKVDSKASAFCSEIVWIAWERHEVSLLMLVFACICLHLLAFAANPYFDALLYGRQLSQLSQEKKWLETDRRTD